MCVTRQGLLQVSYVDTSHWRSFGKQFVYLLKECLSFTFLLDLPSLLSIFILIPSLFSLTSAFIVKIKCLTSMTGMVINLYIQVLQLFLKLQQADCVILSNKQEYDLQSSP